MYEVLARSLSLQISTIEQEELRRVLLANNTVRCGSRMHSVPSS
jgi:hypothetical protein